MSDVRRTLRNWRHKSTPSFFWRHFLVCVPYESGSAVPDPSCTRFQRH